MIVVDASAFMVVLLGQENADAVWARLIGSKGELHILHLTDLEVAQTLRRYVLRRQLDADHAGKALAAFGAFTLVRHRHLDLLPRVWLLRHNITAYDAAYVALAEVLGAPLITRDRRLANAGGHTATIELI